MLFTKTHASFTRQFCLQILRQCPSVSSHRHFVKLYKYLHCSRYSASRLTHQVTGVSVRPSHTCHTRYPESYARTIFNLPPHSSCLLSHSSQASSGILYQCTRDNQSGASTLLSKYYSTSKTKEDPASPDSQAFCDYLVHLLNEYRYISQRLETDESLTDKDRRRLRQRELEMRHVVDQIQQLDQKKVEMKEIEHLMLGEDTKGDKEMLALAKEEMEECQKSIEDMQQEILSLLTPPESTDDNDIIIEMFAGVGGQEAMLFTAEMFEMYQQYAMYKGWKFELVEYATTDLGGARHAVATISGYQVNRYMKYEGGVHRVQRVPKTEKSGRIHTSTMTVAILPQPKDIDMKIDKKDLRIDTMRASGAGGQHVNTTDSAVRIVHLPTGTTVECQQGRSQIHNKQVAMQVLHTRLYNQAMDRLLKEERSLRREQVGFAGRSEKIRTYNFNQDRITDHRASLSVFNMTGFLSGGEQLDDMLESLMDVDREQRLRGLIEDFLETR